MKEWSYFHLSDYKWWTYREFASYVEHAASALRHCGVNPGTVFNIYASTGRHWQVMANGQSPRAQHTHSVFSFAESNQADALAFPLP